MIARRPLNSSPQCHHHPATCNDSIKGHDFFIFLKKLYHYHPATCNITILSLKLLSFSFLKNVDKNALVKPTVKVLVLSSRCQFETNCRGNRMYRKSQFMASFPTTEMHLNPSQNLKIEMLSKAKSNCNVRIQGTSSTAQYTFESWSKS